MIKRMAGGFKRAAALMMSLFIILSQMMLPVAALAQDVNALPALNLSYFAGDAAQSVTVAPALYADQPVYWATLPAEALQNGVTVQIVPTGVEGESYQSAYGDQLMAPDASAVDGAMTATYIEVYFNGALTGSYPLYLSTRELPPEQPVLQPAAVNVKGYDQNGAEIYSGEEWINPGEGREIAAPWIEGYTVSGASSVWVEMYGDGSLSQTSVSFSFQKDLQPAAVSVKGYDQNGAEIYSGEEWITPGEGREISAPWIEGYTVSGASSVWVEMYGDGSLSQSVAEFSYTRVYADMPVTVNYYNENGERIGGYEDSVGRDGKTFWPEMLEGYEAGTPESITVTMDENGQLSQNTVDFYYTRSQPKTAEITVKIVDSADWNSVFYEHTGAYGEGAHSFTPDAAYLPENYRLDSGETVTVNVYADGTADLYEVVFTATYYEPEPEAPKTAGITMKIVDSADWNSVFYEHTGAYGEGAHSFTPDAAYLPENYRLDSSETVTVNVYADGTADLYEVVFTATYHAPAQPEPEQPAEPLRASITMKIVDSADWNNVFYSHSDWYAEGQHTFAPDKSFLPENYQLDNADPAVVNVYADGTADLYEILFTATYHAPEQPEPEQPQEPEQPEQPEQPEEPSQPENGLPEGVILLETLSCEGETTKGSLRFRATPSTDNDKNIVFKGISKGQIVQVTSSVQNARGELWYGIIHEGTACYVKGDCLQLIEKEPVSAKVTFLYQDTDGNAVLDALEETFTEGSYPVAPYQKDAPEGYAFHGVNADTIVVDASGANPAAVVFTYSTVEIQPVTARVTLEYVCEGQPIIEPVAETFEAGSYPVSDYQKTFDGYTFNGASRELIVVEADGSTSDFTVTYDYSRNPVYADVTIHHKLADGSDVPGLTTETKTLSEKTYSVQEFIQSAEGYSYQYASAETITVDANGANPAEITLTYQKIEISADVMIHLQDTDGAPIADTYAVTLGEGAHDASFIQPADPAGYAFDHASHAQITVTAGGADPAEVIFCYRKLPTEARISFQYVDEQGNPVAGLNSYAATLEEGVYDTAVYAATAPAGYLYSGASHAQIVIDQNGASPAEVFFYYTRLPDSVSIPVYHQDADGNPLLDPTAIGFTMADFGKTVNVADVLSITAPEGYVVAGISHETITIDQRGGVTPAAIQVTYVVRPKAEADVTFHYLCNGKSIAESQTHRLTEGSWDTNEYAVKADGYTLTGVDAQTVTIGMDGSASPAEVTFTYEKLVTTANLTVYYRNSFGEAIADPEIRALEKGTHIITPNAAYAPAGYVLSANTQSYEVTVYNDLTLSVSSVSFNYYDQNLTGTVTVNYYDTESATTFATEEVKLAPGTHEIKPNEALVKSKGNYEASDILTNTAVKVDEKGAATPSAVVFYYKPATYQGYQGYLLVTQTTPIRKEAAASGAVMGTLQKDTVLWSGFQYKSGATEWYDAQTQTGDSYRGWVDGAHVRKISAEEARILIEEANQPKEPDQNPGYYITIMNNVPLRQYKTTASQAKYLNINTVVQVSGQEFGETDDYLWHAATYYDYVNKVRYSGFIRDGQLRKLTQEEVDEYLSANDPIDPEENNGNNQYDPNGPSSYGYVTRDQVNFRSEPGGTRIKMLNKYGMALITGTREVNGVTWYNVNYSGQTGWIHGDYFHQMTLSEFTSFMGSEAYYQGITNNTASSSGSSVSGGTKPNTGSTGSATQGNVSSVEDWNVGVWQNTGVTNTTTYQPFNPYATPVATTNPKGSYTVKAENVKFHQMASDASSSVTLPKGAEIEIKGTVTANGKTWYQVTYDGRNGYVDAAAVLDQLSATPTPQPTSTFVIGTMIPITYDDQTTETQTGAVPWGLIGGAIVLVGGAGGVYAYALNQNRKRKAAAARAAAQRRKAAAEA
ncbi:MAG: SH3-like domain-containing protein, partial [Clostridia bacterium]|nr:SH3-like domain-containing protein [Clostridia bacterium]